jgi:glyoxylase-like metal-dependent hydrolase (beta-lactamase superfamily II)
MSRSDTFRRIPTSDGWFEVDEITSNLFAIREPGHFEEPISSLLLGERFAALIDTGCGVGDLRRLTSALTDLPVLVINTHTHIDHLGGNPQFDRIAMFDHPRSREVAEYGVGRGQRTTEILASHLFTRPRPTSLDLGDGSLAPFPVERWLRDGDRIDLGGTELEVIHTPGEAPDHICLLDRREGILFCGDMLLEGPVWTHLDGGSLPDLVRSYRRLMESFDDIRHLMPSHNTPWLDRRLLPETLKGAEAVLAETAEYELVTDPWDRRLRLYPFGRFQILTDATVSSLPH